MKLILATFALFSVLATFSQNQTPSYFCEPGDYSDECQHL